MKIKPNNCNNTSSSHTSVACLGSDSWSIVIGSCEFFTILIKTPSIENYWTHLLALAYLRRWDCDIFTQIFVWIGMVLKLDSSTKMFVKIVALDVSLNLFCYKKKELELQNTKIISRK